MADEKPTRKTRDGREWRLFVFPAILAAIGAYFALTYAAPKEAQRAATPAAESAAPKAQ